jgi:cytochrome c peroxidase
MLAGKAIRSAQFVCLLGGAGGSWLGGCAAHPVLTDEAAAGSSGIVAQGSGLSLSAQLGKQLFFDKSLSASGTMSCATCHDPAHAYGPSNGLSVQLGGPGMNRTGTRAVPSLRYKEYTPPFADLLDNPDGISAPGPGGGLTWDGRAPTLAEQARVPLLSSVEMAKR